MLFHHSSGCAFMIMLFLTVFTIYSNRDLAQNGGKKVTGEAKAGGLRNKPT
jgi:hypothetical protein